MALYKFFFWSGIGTYQEFLLQNVKMVCGKHKANECQKPKCCNCGESYTANYRGCIVAKEPQSTRNKNLMKHKVSIIFSSTSNNPSTINKNDLNNPHRVQTSKFSFSEVVKSNSKVMNAKNPKLNELTQILEVLNKQEFNVDFCSRLDNLEK